MCGILGAFSGDRDFHRIPFTASDLDRMTHRGPDGQGWFVAEHAIMGFRRLAIIDIAGGMQPLFSEDEQIVLTINGEIYNHRQLRAELEAKHSFHSRVDGEVLVHLYEEYGLQMLDRANGMFVFALYDRRANRMILGRDRGGQKPLYYEQRGKELRWASEIRVLLQSRRPPISREALDEYLRFGYVPAPLTMIEGVYKLPASTLLVAEAGKAPVMRNYWRLDYRRDERDAPQGGELETWSASLRTWLDRSVAFRLESEVPMGFLLSGGIDSASVFASAALADGKLKPVAFTVGLPGESIDESSIAREVAQRYNAEHIVVELAREKAAALSEVIPSIEEPVATDALLPTNEVFLAVSGSNVTTVLTGEGADELFAGYSKFRHAAPWNPESRRPYRSALERYLAFEEFVFEDAERERLIGREAHNPTRFQDLEDEAADLDPLAQMLLIENRLRLPDRINLRLDRLSMAYSIEARAPFMDYELMQSCAAIPRCLLSDPDTEKLILRHAMKDRLPVSVVSARKAPFRTPVNWHTGGDVIEKTLDRNSVAEAGLVSWEETERVKDRARHPDEREAREGLFSLFVLHTWFNAFYAQLHTGRANDSIRSE